MISEFFLNILFGIVDKFFGFMPNFVWSPEGAAINFISDCVAGVVYLFPMGAVWGIVKISLSLLGIRVVISLIRTIWDLLPIV